MTEFEIFFYICNYCIRFLVFLNMYTFNGPVDYMGFKLISVHQGNHDFHFVSVKYNQNYNVLRNTTLTDMPPKQNPASPPQMRLWRWKRNRK